MSTSGEERDQTSTNRNEQDWTKSCPICFVEGAVLARSPSCGHAFCIGCLGQFFALDDTCTDEEDSNSISRQHGPVDTDTSLLDQLQCRNLDGIATLERCPLCRFPMSLVAMIHVENGEPVWSRGRCTNWEETPLAGKVFATRKGIGFDSFHFPSKTCAGNDDHVGQQLNPPPNRRLPYLLWRQDRSLYPHPSDTRHTSTPYYFDPGSFYFAPKRTFHGTLSLPDAHGNPQRHDVLLCFAAPNHSWITGGFILRSPSQAPPSFKWTSYYPLDGRWKVTWYSEKLDPGRTLHDCDDLVIDTDYLDVKGNVAHDAASMQYMLRYDDKDRIYFHWPGWGVTQTLEPQDDFRRNRGAPDVGDLLRWTTSDTQQPYIVWERETIEAHPHGSGSIEYFGRSGGQTNMHQSNPLNTFLGYHHAGAWYREVRGTTTTTGNLNGPPRYVPEQLWGNTFCHDLQVGLASYHFGMMQLAAGQQEAQPFAYISYESDACSRLPPLDDGSPIPPRVYFHNISVHEVQETRSVTNLGPEEEEEITAADSSCRVTTTHVVFRGTVEWLEDYGTTWLNHERCEYEMRFDSQFTCIASGTVHCTAATTERELLLKYGTDLVYINAGIVDAFGKLMEENVEGLDDNVSGGGDALVADGGFFVTMPRERYLRYATLSRRIRRRLQGEGASINTMAMLSRVFTLMQQPGTESPISYN
jgi:hypothetical protein